MGRGKKTYREITLLISYLLGLNAFLSLWGIADNSLILPFFILFLLGAYNDFFKTFRIPRIILNSIALAGTILFLLSISFDNLVEPIANALLLLVSVKFLEEKGLRDFYQILLLSLLSVSLSTLIKTDILFILFLLFELFVGIFFLFLLLLYKRLGDKEVDFQLLKKLFFLSFGFGLSVFFTSWIFFFTLPRVDNPIIDVFQKREKGLISGISDEISLGEVGEIHLDETVIFRVFGVEFKEAPYWRVQVFDTYVNNRWIRTIYTPERELSGGSPYTIILEPTYDTFIPLLNYPTRLMKVEGKKDKPTRFKGGYYLFREPITKPLKIEALYTTSPPTDEPIDVYLSLPKNIPERVRSLARKLMNNTRTSEEKIKKLKEFFKKEGFRYTLKLGSYEGDPLEYFLFESKEGNCEYYASATAILLRLMGVPARVVSGFHGAIRNEYGNYYFVIGGMAHVWVEAYTNGRWITVDTTPPYIPEAFSRINTLTYIYDAILTFWYKNIVDFSREKQVNLLIQTRDFVKNLFEILKKNLPLLTLLFIFLLISLAFSYFYVHELRKTPENLFKKLKRKLKNYGIEGELPEEILRNSEGHPKYRYIEFIVRTYERWKYSPFKDKEELKEAYKVLKKI